MCWMLGSRNGMKEMLPHEVLPDLDQKSGWSTRCSRRKEAHGGSIRKDGPGFSSSKQIYRTGG